MSMVMSFLETLDWRPKSYLFRKIDGAPWLTIGEEVYDRDAGGWTQPHYQRTRDHSIVPSGQIVLVLDDVIKGAEMERKLTAIRESFRQQLHALQQETSRQCEKVMEEAK